MHGSRTSQHARSIVFTVETFLFSVLGWSELRFPCRRRVTLPFIFFVLFQSKKDRFHVQIHRASRFTDHRRSPLPNTSLRSNSNSRSTSSRTKQSKQPAVPLLTRPIRYAYHKQRTHGETSLPRRHRRRTSRLGMAEWDCVVCLGHSYRYRIIYCRSSIYSQS